MELRINRVRINRPFWTWNNRHLAKFLQKLRIKWIFELTAFELTGPDLYYISTSSKRDTCRSCRIPHAESAVATRTAEETVGILVYTSVATWPCKATTRIPSPPESHAHNAMAHVWMDYAVNEINTNAILLRPNTVFLMLGQNVYKVEISS